MKRLFYSLIIATLVSTIAIGAEVRKVTKEDFLVGNPDNTYTSPGGHVGHYISNQVVSPFAVDVRDHGATGDGSTDDSTAINAALALGGNIVIGGSNKTYRVSGANLSLKSNTRLVIPRGTTLWLDTTRISSVNQDNVTIVGGGVIKSTSLNNTDTLPTDWAGMGILSFGGLIATPAKNFVIDGIEVWGDWDGTPGDISISANDRRRGIYLQNVSNAKVINCDVHGIRGEAIAHNGGANDGSVLFANNTVHRFNHDGLNFNDSLNNNLSAIGNHVYDGLVGIEMAAGSAIGNTLDSLLNAGVYCGAGGGMGPVVIKNNRISRITGTSGVGIQCTFNTPVGPVSVIGNTIDNTTQNGIILEYNNDLEVSGNHITKWGTSGTGNYGAIATSNITRGLIAGNSISNSGGASATSALDISGTSVKVGENHLTPLSLGQHKTSMQAATGLSPPPLPKWQYSIQSLTATTNETTKFSLTIPAYTLSYLECFHVLALGTSSGTAGTKTIKLKWGGTTPATLTQVAGSPGPWEVKGWFCANASSGSNIINTFVDNGTLVTRLRSATSVNAAVDTTLSLTGQLGDGGDTINFDLWVVEPWVPLRGVD